MLAMVKNVEKPLDFIMLLPTGMKIKS